MVRVDSLRLIPESTGVVELEAEDHFPGHVLGTWHERTYGVSLSDWPSGISRRERESWLFIGTGPSLFYEEGVLNASSRSGADNIKKGTDLVSTTTTVRQQQKTTTEHQPDADFVLVSMMTQLSGSF